MSIEGNDVIVPIYIRLLFKKMSLRPGVLDII